MSYCFERSTDQTCTDQKRIHVKRKHNCSFLIEHVNGFYFRFKTLNVLFYNNVNLLYIWKTLHDLQHLSRRDLLTLPHGVMYKQSVAIIYFKF